MGFVLSLKCLLMIMQLCEMERKGSELNGMKSIQFKSNALIRME